MSAEKRVHLDHHIKRQSIRYNPSESPAFASSGINSNNKGTSVGREDNAIRISDIEGEWFNRVKKPDFQRETNAWSPEQCVSFLDSVIYGKIIPSIILWRNEITGSVFVLDGAHRLSVVRAWMKNDWGGKRENYYKRKNLDNIKSSSRKVRELIRKRPKIGTFEDFEKAFEKKEQIVNEGKAPMNEMSKAEFERAKAYADIFMGNRTLTAQWERGDYESAEESFLRINRQGQPLGNWESLLIEYRNSSYARTIMCVASGGESGHYWPNISEENKEISNKLDTFHKRCEKIYDRLFVPSFKTPIDDLTVPMMVAPEYFQKHKYLLEIIPLLTERNIAEGEKQQIEILERDSGNKKEEIIRNGDEIIHYLEQRLDHISGDTNDPKTLSLVPLFYWYNHKGQYKRGLLYGFLYWLLSGSEGDIFSRKLNFSAVRKSFEFVIFEYKAEIPDYERSIGAGLKSTKRMGEFYDRLISLLLNNTDNVGNESFEKDFLNIMSRTSRKKKRASKKSRTASTADKNEVNIRELFEGSVNCHICGGIVDIKSGVHYDHVEKYSENPETHPNNLKPTHPFCNNNRDKIQDIIGAGNSSILPEYYTDSSSEKRLGRQTSLFDEEFPS